MYLLAILLSMSTLFFDAQTVEAKDMSTNRLIKEKSPYLLQHAHNPVDWYPWGDEAFEKARKEQKPVFVSIGYSTCHWCHVMEEESFSKPEIAEILNANFVSIKVDREERPDIDQVYMNAVQMMTGSSGWPLSVFLTPDKKPFYGGTYFPPEDRWGRPGFKTVLNSISDAWQNRRDEILQSGETIVDAIRKSTETVSSDGFSLSEGTLKKAYEGFASRFDSTYGGFGSAPKFPMGHSFSFLLRYWKRTGEPQALNIVEGSLSEIAKGGIYDHLGGGFHRYSTDAKWRVPHFEKMLYDQAILSKAYLEAYQVTGKDEYAQVARDIFEYVLRDLTSPEGHFYSAEDADSLTSFKSNAKKEEGAFYTWTDEEIEEELGKQDAFIFNYYFGREEGILYIAHDLKDTAAHFNKSISEIGNIISASKEKLFNARSKRPRPYMDDKVLVDWNGLMISSLAFGSRVLNDPHYSNAAEKSAKFILNNIQREDGRLLHRYREGEAAILGTLEDYAFFIHGLFDLYEATFKLEYLLEAKQLAEGMFQLFWDDLGAGFFWTADDAEKLFLRQKEIYDGALPSGNSIAALNLIRLSRLTMTREFEAKVEGLFKGFSNQIHTSPQAYPQMLIALDFALGPSREIVVTGDRDSKETKDMISSLYSRFIPNKVVAFRPASIEEAKPIVGIIPFLERQLPLNEKTTV